MKGLKYEEKHYSLMEGRFLNLQIAFFDCHTYAFEYSRKLVDNTNMSLFMINDNLKIEKKRRFILQ